MSKSKIRWTDYTLNYYLWRCTKISPGCKNCYMFAQAYYFGQNPNEPLGERFDRAEIELAGFKKRSIVFVNSMSDTYHEAAPVRWIHRIHNNARSHPDQHFLLLTKRIERALALSPHLDYPPNLWVGTSVENEDYLPRLDYLLKIPAAGHFVSVEPLLGPLPGLQSYIPHLDWVIVGGESGAKRRPFDKEWARQIRDMQPRVFMFKQGGHRFSERDQDLDGRTWDEIPAFFPLEKSEESLVPEPISTIIQLAMF